MATKTAVRAALLQHRKHIIGAIEADLVRYCPWYTGVLNGLWVRYSVDDNGSDRVALLGRCNLKTHGELRYPELDGGCETAEQFVRAWAGDNELFVGKHCSLERRGELEITFFDRADTLRPGKKLTLVNWRIAVPVVTRDTISAQDVIAASVVEFSLHEALEAAAVDDGGVSAGGVARYERAGTPVADWCTDEVRPARKRERFVAESHPLWPHEDWPGRVHFEVLMRLDRGPIMALSSVSF
jgi:hypothetical protein